MNNKLYSFTAPEGRYYIGDPCYAIKGDKGDDHWSKWLHNAGIDNDDCSLLSGTIDGKHTAYGFGTAHGDGCYTDKAGREYSVDAGLIGLVPVAYLEEYNIPIEKDWVFVTFDKPTFCYKMGGTLVFGSIEIETDFEEVEEYDEDEYYEEDEE